MSAREAYELEIRKSEARQNKIRSCHEKAMNGLRELRSLLLADPDEVKFFSEHEISVEDVQGDYPRVPQMKILCEAKKLERVVECFADERSMYFNLSNTKLPFDAVSQSANHEAKLGTTAEIACKCLQEDLGTYMARLELGRNSHA